MLLSTLYTMSDYVYFWRLSEDNAVFSQWYPSKFIDGYGMRWYTAEQFMMYHKAKTFKDEKIATRILNNPRSGPAYHKSLGRQIENFKMDVWRQVCENIVFRANMFKFSQNTTLKEMILDTGDKILVEASPPDSLWGIGFDAEMAELYIEDWGENLLGKVLMRVRSELRK